MECEDMVIGKKVRIKECLATACANTGRHDKSFPGCIQDFVGKVVVVVENTDKNHSSDPDYKIMGTEKNVVIQEMRLVDQSTPADLFLVINDFSPIVKSIGVRRGDKERTFQSNGTMLPGIHDFGIIDREEIIQVIKGHIKINGRSYTPHSGPCLIKFTDRVVFETEVVSNFSCHFPEFE